MAGNPKIVALYRTTEPANTNQRPRGLEVNMFDCLKNFASSCQGAAEIVLFADRVTNPTRKAIIDILDDGAQYSFVPTTTHGNSETFLEALEYALVNYEPADIIYFVEDDYLHVPGFASLLIEGLSRADYVSLYDHPDKYNGGQEHLFYTANHHWKYTHSTTMTFAATVKTLAFDQPIFEEMVTTGNPPDHYIFTRLTQELHRRLATPIPALATHTAENYLAPVVDWKKL